MKGFAFSLVRLVAPCVLVAFSAPRAFAQAGGTGAIEGTVSIAGTNTPLPDASVSVVGTARGARTDAAGKFRIPGLAAGSYQLRAQRIGYTSLTKEVTLAAGGTATAEFVLRE